MLLVGPIALGGEEATARLARALAPLLRPGDALLLDGPLGAGKSAFARALIRARLRDAAAEVPSPTFTLVQTYGAGQGLGADEIWHADLYRLGGPAEVPETGLPDAFPTVIALVEWPDRLGPFAPPGALRLLLSPLPDPDLDPDAREARLLGPAAWAPRLRPLLELADG